MSWLQVPPVDAPLPRDVRKPETTQLCNLLRAERELEARRAFIRRTSDERGRTKGAQGGRGSLPPLGLRTYLSRVAVQAEDEGPTIEDEIVATEAEQ